MPGQQLRVGLVGCGRRGRGHAEIINSHDLSDIVAVCDPSEIWRETAAKTFNAQPFESAQQMLESAGIDAVIVSAPAHLNATVALPVIEAGFTTLLEKPPGLKVHDVKQLRDAANRSGARVMVGFDRRFNPFVRAAVEAIAEQGELRQVVAEFHKDIREWTQDPRFSPEMFDVLMLESPVHSVDLLTFFAGSPVANVSSVVRRRGSDYRNVHAALIEFESGCVAQFTASLTAGGRLERYELHGEQVSAYLEGVKEGTTVKDGSVRQITAPGEGVTSTVLQDDFFVRRALDGGKFDEPAATLESSIATLDLAERIYAAGG